MRFNLAITVSLVLTCFVVLGSAAPTVPQINTQLDKRGLINGYLNVTCTGLLSCTATSSGNLTMLLTNGQSVKGQSLIIAQTNNNGSWFAVTTANSGVTSVNAPLTLVCNTLSGYCTGAYKAALTAIINNAHQIDEWDIGNFGGSCIKGVCSGAINTSGDPSYKK